MVDPQEQFYSELEKRKFFNDLGKTDIFNKNPDFLLGKGGVHQQLQAYSLEEAIAKLHAQHKIVAAVPPVESAEQQSTPKRWISAFSLFKNKEKEKVSESKAGLQKNDKPSNR